jgi:hypothetical protein
MTGSNQHATTMIRGKTNRARGGFIEAPPPAVEFSRSRRAECP